MSTEKALTIGMLRNSGSPGPVALACAHSALMYGARLIFFTPDDVNPDEKKINGLHYIAGEGWRRICSGYPHVIDNDEQSRYKTDIFNALHAEIPVTTHPLGGKRYVFNKLKEHGMYQDLIIPGCIIRNRSDVFDNLHTHERIVIKPVKGAMGRNVFYLQKNDDGSFHGNIRGDKLHLNHDGIHHFYDKEIKGKNYFCQRYIESKTRSGLPFDIRLHVRRGHDGLWKTVKIYARIGSGHTITSNLSAGGSITGMTNFIRSQYSDSLAMTIIKNLRQLAKDFPVSFQKMYNQTLDALGIDIGIDTSGRMWLFEVNSFPGAMFFEIEDAVHRMGYAVFLGSRNKQDK